MSLSRKEYDNLVREGTTAARSGSKALARRLLERAVSMNSQDERPYLWLAHIEADPGEKIQLLEKAVIVNPANSETRRQLAVLKGELDPDTFAPRNIDGTIVGPERPQGVQDVSGGTFDCPNCGASMHFDVDHQDLKCNFCGTLVVNKEIPMLNEGRFLDYVLPLAEGHVWAEAKHRLACANCGAKTLVLPAHNTQRCPFCGSNHLFEHSEEGLLVEPDGIVLFRVSREAARKRVSRWISKNAGVQAGKTLASLQLRGAYYSFWIFDGEVRLPYFVAETNENKHLTKRFNSLAVAGAKMLPDYAGNFNIEQAVEIQPDHFAGWDVISYDRPVSDASLAAHGEVVKSINKSMIGVGEWRDLTYRHLLLPIWLAEYTHAGKTSRVFMNGQTGQWIAAESGQKKTSQAGDSPFQPIRLDIAIILAIAMGVAMLIWLLSGT